MKQQEIICTICPVSCRVTLTEDKDSKDGYKIEGAGCKRGEVYGINEITNPTRLVTSTVKVNNDSIKRLPVRTDDKIPKGKMKECMEIINSIEVNSDVTVGDVLYEDLFGLGINIVASKSLKLK